MKSKLIAKKRKLSSTLKVLARKRESIQASCEFLIETNDDLRKHLKLRIETINALIKAK